MKRLLTGNIPGGKTSFSIKGDIPNPGLCLGQTLATRLIEEGLDIAEVNTTYDKYLGQMYAAERSSFAEEIFYTHNSFPLKDIIKDTNVRSNNHYAEHLIRTVGRTKNKDIYSSALDEGIEKTSQLWKARG